MKAHLDLNSGIAGDMFMAACLDAGLDEGALKAALGSLGLPRWELTATRQTRAGIAGTHVHVHYAQEHAHRHLGDIAALITASALPAPVQDRALAIFQTLAEAEAKVHGTTPDRVHFHEVGAVDSIIDICGAAFAVWQLGITEITATPVPTGSGVVRCDHGVMPVPVPAVVELCRRHRIPLRPDPIPFELVTPTGAAILGSLVTRFDRFGLTRIDKIGYGLGTRNFPDRANAVRLLLQDDSAAAGAEAGAELGDDAGALVRETVAVLSTHIDDMNPEWFSLVWERLFAGGAVDVALIPIYMKKGRPATRLEVMCPLPRAESLARAVLTETTALGVRVQQVDRLILRREKKSFATPWGAVRAVVADGIFRVEYEDLATVARAQGWPLPETYQRLLPFLSASATEQG